MPIERSCTSPARAIVELALSSRSAHRTCGSEGCAGTSTGMPVMWLAHLSTRLSSRSRVTNAVRKRVGTTKAPLKKLNFSTVSTHLCHSTINLVVMHNSVAMHWCDIVCRWPEGGTYEAARVHQPARRHCCCLAAYGARAAAGADTAHWGANAIDRGRSRRTNPTRSPSARAATVRLDNRAEPAGRIPLGCRQCRSHAQVCG